MGGTANVIKPSEPRMAAKRSVAIRPLVLHTPPFAALNDDEVQRSPSGLATLRHCLTRPVLQCIKRRFNAPRHTDTVGQLAERTVPVTAQAFPGR